MLLDLVPTPATLSVYYGTDASKAASASKNTMWFNNPLRGAGYNIRGTSSGTASISSPVLKSGLVGETNNYFEHYFASGNWSYGIEVMGMDGTSVFTVGMADHPAAPIGISATKSSSTANAISFTPNWEAEGTQIFYKNSTGVTKNDTSVSLTSNPYTLSGLTNDTDFYYALASVKNGAYGVLSAEKYMRTGTLFFDSLINAAGGETPLVGQESAVGLTGGSTHVLSSSGMSISIQDANANYTGYYRCWSTAYTPYSGLSCEFEVVSLTTGNAANYFDFMVYMGDSNTYPASTYNQVFLRFSGSNQAQATWANSTGAQTALTATTSGHVGVWKLVVTSTSISVYKNGSLVSSTNSVTNFNIASAATARTGVMVWGGSATPLTATFKNLKAY